MTKISTWLVVLITAFLISGCASKQPQVEKATQSTSLFNNTPIAQQDHFVINEDINGELYRVSAQGSTKSSNTYKMRSNVERQANRYCKKEHLDYQMLAVSECTTYPPYTADNYPKLEILFVCVKNGLMDTKYNNEKFKYEQVVDMKILLNGGTLTQTQFDIEKSKVLEERYTSARNSLIE